MNKAQSYIFFKIYTHYLAKKKNSYFVEEEPALDGISFIK